VTPTLFTAPAAGSFDGGAVLSPRLYLRLLTTLSAIVVFTPSLAAAPAGWAPNLTATATWDDNVTNANHSTDIIGALAFAANFAAAQRISLDHDDSLVLTAHVSGESFPEFTALDRASVGAQTAWRHKFGIGAQAPIFSVEFSGDASTARETDRSGLGAGVAFAWRQRFGESTLVALSQDFSRFDARGAVFDRSASETALVVTQTLADRWSFSATVRFRQGDVLSYATPPRPDLVALARIRSPVNTFGRPMVAYSLDAHTLGGALALTRTLDDRTSLALAAEYRATGHAALRYVNRLVSVALSRQL